MIHYLINLQGNEFQAVENYFTNKYLIILYIYTKRIRKLRKIIFSIQINWF